MLYKEHKMENKFLSFYLHCLHHSDQSNTFPSQQFEQHHFVALVIQIQLCIHPFPRSTKILNELKSKI